jgi:hypothetical protein
LRCKVLQKRYLLIAKWTYLLAVDRKDAKHSVFLTKRHAKKRPCATEFDERCPTRVAAPIKLIFGGIDGVVEW